jgi:DNA-binding transcriptional LysR family regulator
MEKRIGRLLLERRRNSLAPMERRAAFFERLSEAFRALSNAVAELEDNARDRLTVSVAPVFASKWLVPGIGAFRELRPEIQLLIDANASFVDLNDSDSDVAIRVGV